jgi:hypothetical protein
VCCQVETAASGRSLVQRRPTESTVSECDHEEWTMRRPRPIRAFVSYRLCDGPITRPEES